MTGQELEQQAYSFIDQGQFLNALDSINVACPGEIHLDKPHLAKLMAYVHDEGIRFDQGCSVWWALPSEPHINEDTGEITPVGEAAEKLHRALLKQLKWIGMEEVNGYEFEFDVAVPPSVVLALAADYATANGVHVP